jgi:hypothetical protein
VSARFGCEPVDLQSQLRHGIAAGAAREPSSVATMATSQISLGENE